MIDSLSHDEKSLQCHDWKELSRDTLKLRFESKEVPTNFFRKQELQLCLRTVKEKLQAHGIQLNVNWPKYKIIELFTLKQRVDPTVKIPGNRKTAKKNSLKTLKDLCSKVCKSLPKEFLARTLAKLTWNEVESSWTRNSPVAYNGVAEVVDNIQWFSKPAMRPNGKLMFHFTDAFHILTCLRTKICTTGIDKRALEKAALSSNTKLNIAVVLECVDKQDVGIACGVSAEDVELKMEEEFPAEAEFCRLLRKWFEAEDEPSIPAVERCRR